MNKAHREKRKQVLADQEAALLKLAEASATKYVFKQRAKTHMNIAITPEYATYLWGRVGGTER